MPARAAPDPRGLAERGIRERVQRLLERAELLRDQHEPFLCLEPAVDLLELLCDPVEPLEQRVELAVGDVTPFHAGDSSRRPLTSSSRRVHDDGPAPSSPSSRSSAPVPVSTKLTRRAAPSWASAICASSSGASVKTPSRAPDASSRRSAALVSALGRR